MSWKLLQWQQIRQNEWSFQAGTKKKTCTNRKSLLQTSSNHVAPIKTLIECLDSTATSRPFTIPKKSWHSTTQVTSSHSYFCYATPINFLASVELVTFSSCRSERRRMRSWAPVRSKDSKDWNTIRPAVYQLHPVITTAGHKGNPELGAMLHYPTLPERAASCGNLRLPSQVPPPPSDTKGRKQESKDRLI